MTDEEHTAEEWREACMSPTELAARKYATQLAVSTWNKHYKQDAPQWEPLDDLFGVLSQLDNMLAGLTRQTDHAPVAYLHKWLPHASTIGQSLSFNKTTPHKGDVAVIPLYMKNAHDHQT